MTARAASFVLLVATTLAAPVARAADEPAATAAGIDLSRDTREAVAPAELAPAEAPPPEPYSKSLVLDASLGAMGFLSEFGKVSPPGAWMRVLLGYELLRWLLIFGEGELGFTDTSNRHDPPMTRAFPLFGFGGGARFTVRLGERVGIYAQASVGALKADVATNALGILGFRDAESLDLYACARLGGEYYQINRHFALGLNAGVRTARGFAKLGAGTDTPIAIDGGPSLRYAF